MVVAVPRPFPPANVPIRFILSWDLYSYYDAVVIGIRIRLPSGRSRDPEFELS